MTGWKKYAALFGMAALVMCMGVSQTGCSGRERENTETDDGKISVVTTIFRLMICARDCRRSGGSEDAAQHRGKRRILMSQHPRISSRSRRAMCLFYTGGENDVWVEDILSSMPDDDRITLRLLDCVDTVERTCGRNEGRGRS